MNKHKKKHKEITGHEEKTKRNEQTPIYWLKVGKKYQKKQENAL